MAVSNDSLGRQTAQYQRYDLDETTYNNASVGSGSVVNESLFAYNDFAQLLNQYQAHGGAVNTSTSPKVQYAYANGSANTIRPTTMTYPDGAC